MDLQLPLGSLTHAVGVKRVSEPGADYVVGEGGGEVGEEETDSHKDLREVPQQL